MVRFTPCVYLPRLVLGYLVVLDAQLVLVLWGILKFDESILLPGSTIDTGSVQHWWSPKKFPGQHLAARRLFALVALGKSMPLSLLSRAQLHVGRRRRNISETEPRQLSPATAQQLVRCCCNDQGNETQ